MRSVQPTKMAAPGEDVAHNKNCTAQALAISQQSWSQRQHKFGEIIDQQRSPYASCLRFADLQLGISSDGIGSKIEVAERMQRYDSLGFDLMAMVMDDLAAQGFEPSNLNNVLDVDQLDAEIIAELMTGLKQAAKVAQVALSGGEIAELGQRVAGWGRAMHFNWSATGIGFLPSGRELVDGHQLQAGDQLVFLASRGLRSNGYSLARRILHQAFADTWHQHKISATLPDDDNNNQDSTNTQDNTWGEYLLRPARIFSPIIQSALQQGLRLHGLAHVTGGGLLGALQRLLGEHKLGAQLTSLCPIPSPMRVLQQMGNLDDTSACRQWNMGQGFIVALAEQDLAALQKICTAHLCPSQQAGQITANPELAIKTSDEPQMQMRFANSAIASGLSDSK